MNSFRRLVYAQATPRTHLFDDYTEGSYHVSKLDLAEGLRQRRAGGTPIVAALIHGPLGPLWQYNVFVFLREGDGVRVNGLWMPHARITEKSTNYMSMRDARSLLANIEASASVAVGHPLESLDDPDDNPEWQYDLLLLDWTDGSEVMFHTTTLFTFSVEPSQSELCVDEAIGEIHRGGIWTYTSDISEEESIYHQLTEPPPEEQ